MSTPDQRPDQQQYWNQNLDPKNLIAGSEVKRDYRRELKFYFTPDQLYALEQFGPLSQKLVLEIGAGLGVNAMYMSSQGASVVAIDMAHERLQAIQDAAINEVRGGKLLLVKAVAESLPFKEQAFDHAFSKAVLIHTQLEQAIPEIRRVMKPNSVSVFLEPMAGNPLANLYRKTLAPSIWQSIARYFTKREIDIFKQAFPDTKVKYFYLFSFAAFAWQFAIPAPRLFYLFLKPSHQIETLLMRLAPGLKKLSWFAAVCVRR